MGLLLASSAWAQGTARSLDIQPGARQVAMGAAGVALADDPTGVSWWNPAALGYLGRPSLELTYSQLVPGLATDVTYNYINYLHPVEGWGSFGVGVLFLSYGNIDITNTSGQQLQTYTPVEYSPALYYGTQILPDLAVGAAVKYVRVQLAPSSYQGIGSTFGFDLGALYKIPQARLNFGLNVQNLGPALAFVDEDKADPLSRNVKVGAAWVPFVSKEFTVTLVEDYNQSLVNSNFRTFNHGAELSFEDQLAGRIGWVADPSGDISGLSYGLGVAWNSLSLDWGSMPQARTLPSVTRITLGYRF
ncbi:MAG: PorV/PorQ family protein [Candidatus Eisenbacteria bacterium]|uniref:PorV/PorQ family protein n=1 Tax=Eiseniibacteriota bacterium TaxID=2212470 RepID=A0A9D6L6W3_UNCEI|nr:PorV/PorQ family protein [Candidatus Eisenbacteria bacterium]